MLSGFVEKLNLQSGLKTSLKHSSYTDHLTAIRHTAELEWTLLWHGRYWRNCKCGNTDSPLFDVFSFLPCENWHANAFILCQI